MEENQYWGDWDIAKIVIALLFVGIWIVGFLTAILKPNNNPTPLIPPPKYTPTSVKPDLSVEWDRFPYTGCLERYPFRFRYCVNEAPSGDLSDVFFCDDNIRNRDMLFGGLSPSYPIAMCTHPIIYQPDYEYLYYIYFAPIEKRGVVHYITYDGVRYQTITSVNDLKQVFAPIESIQEALSYVIIATDFYAFYYDGTYGHRNPYNYPSFYPHSMLEFKETRVIQQEDGYIINLFSASDFIIRCEDLDIFEVNLHVANDGTIEQLNRTKIYEEPLDESCMD